MKILKYTLVLFLVIVGLGLIVGASWNLPESAQDVVTGRSQMLMDELIDRAGEQQLLDVLVGNFESNAVSDAGAIGRFDVEIVGYGIEFFFDEDSEDSEDMGLDDVINSGLSIEAIYQQAVDADLLTQIEADKLLQSPIPR